MRRVVEGVDVIFHLAALIGIPYSYETPLAYVRTNIEGTVNVLQAALAGNAEMVVHTSTSEVYGSAQYVPMDEGHPLQGQSPYSASKIGADKLCEAFHRSFGLPVATVRPFNTFGPRQSARAVLPTIISQALTGDRIELGDTKPTRDLTFVSDTVEGFIRAAESERSIGEVVNIGSGSEISIGDLATTVLGVLGEDKPVVLDRRRLRPEASEVDRLCAETSKAKRLLGWTPSHTLEEGLEETVEWITTNLKEYRVGAYAV